MRVYGLQGLCFRALVSGLQCCRVQGVDEVFTGFSALPDLVLVVGFWKLRISRSQVQDLGSIRVRLRVLQGLSICGF